jgi:UDP-GlcNAc:undecaprenyl-phosphate/decaprenyl-phosphate GlcNAc-1-phosphate transferase
LTGSAAAGVAFGLSLALVGALAFLPVLQRLLVRAARGERWRVDAVPVSGGIAMAAAFTTVAVAVAWDDPVVPPLLAAGCVALVVGLIDDLRALPPLVKVGGQIAAGAVLVATGVRFPLPGDAVVGAVVTVLWVVVVANAVNLIDNMDGLAAGVAAVAAITMWMWWSAGDGTLPDAVPAALAGALLGFLVFNARRARIFMGDSGSLWLGSTLAGLTVVDGGRVGGAGDAEWWLVLAVPALLMGVALFDTTLVLVERLRHGRPVMVGGADHTSHRLVGAGLGPGGAVAVLWLFAAAGAGAATTARLGIGPFVASTALLVVAFAVLARRVVAVEVYG